MAAKRESGLGKALDLDQEAQNLLDKGCAAAAETGAAAGDPEAEQLALFAGSSVFGRLRQPGGESIRTGGPGRPRGSQNRSTRDLVKLIEATGRHPLLAMAEIVATPIDVIAATLGCKKIEAADYHRKVMADLAPYVAQKLPTAVQVQGANAGMLVINLGGPVGEAAAGLDMRLVEGAAMPTIEHEENQGLGDDEPGQSHAAQSHDEGK